MVMEHLSRRQPARLRSGATATTLCLALLAGALTTAPARSADLSDALLAAAKADTDPAERRRACAEFQPMSISAGLGNLAEAKRIPISGLSDLPDDTRGVHLADAPAGGAAPPFVQALLDAGAASRLTLGWTRVVTVPTHAVPVLRDLGIALPPNAPPPEPPFTDRSVGFQKDAFVVTGSDRAFFPNEHAYGFAIGQTTEADYDDPASTIAPGFWVSRHVCVVLVPKRILEYSDVREIGNGFREVTATLVFRPRRMPSWIADPRVIPALYPNLLPWSVRMSAFRNDGSGWRQLPGSSGSPAYMTHLVE
jgi:hypothetical protein